MSDIDSETICPECGSLRTARLISNVAFFTTSSNGARRALAGASVLLRMRRSWHRLRRLSPAISSFIFLIDNQH